MKIIRFRKFNACTRIVLVIAVMLLSLIAQAQTKTQVGDTNVNPSDEWINPQSATSTISNKTTIDTSTTSNLNIFPWAPICDRKECDGLLALESSASVDMACPLKELNAVGKTGELQPQTDPRTCTKRIEIVCGEVPSEGARACCGLKAIHIAEEDCQRIGLQTGTYCLDCLNEILRVKIVGEFDEKAFEKVDAACVVTHELRHFNDYIDNGWDILRCKTEVNAHKKEFECLTKYYDQFCGNPVGGELSNACKLLADTICFVQHEIAIYGCICSKSLGLQIPECLGCSNSCQMIVSEYCQAGHGFASNEAQEQCDSLTKRQCELSLLDYWRDRKNRDEIENSLRGMDNLCAFRAQIEMIRCDEVDHRPMSECIMECKGKVRGCNGTERQSNLMCDPFGVQ